MAAVGETGLQMTVPQSSANPIVFLDTEFTDLVATPLLLSIGLVAGGSGLHEFYAEVVDRLRIGSASQFASNIVLPQFGRVRGSACTYLELGARLATYLDGLTSELRPGRVLTVAYESDLDWTLLERAVRETDETRWSRLMARLRPVNVYNIAGFAVGDRAAKAYFDKQRLAPLARHHALCDARALRVAYAAAAASTASRARAAETLQAGA